MVSLRVWSARPYASPTLEFGTAEVHKIEHIEFTINACSIGGELLTRKQYKAVAFNDGFDSIADLQAAFAERGQFVFFTGKLITFRGMHIDGAAMEQIVADCVGVV